MGPLEVHADLNHPYFLDENKQSFDPQPQQSGCTPRKETHKCFSVLTGSSTLLISLESPLTAPSCERNPSPKNLFAPNVFVIERGKEREKKGNKRKRKRKERKGRKEKNRKIREKKEIHFIQFLSCMSCISGWQRTSCSP